AGNATVRADGAVAIDMTTGAEDSILDGIGSLTRGSGRAGDVGVAAGAVAITNAGTIASLTAAGGNSGEVTVSVSGMRSMNGLNAALGLGTGIAADAEPGRRGNAGKVTVTAGISSIVNGGSISSNTFGFGKGGNVYVTVDNQLSIDGGSIAAVSTPE